MMWDFGGGNTYTPGEEDARRARAILYTPQDTPPYQGVAASPFAPLVGPYASPTSSHPPTSYPTSSYPESSYAQSPYAPDSEYASSTYSNPPSTIRTSISSSSYPATPAPSVASSYPPPYSQMEPFAGGFAPRDVLITVEQSHSTYESHHESHRHSRPHRSSNASRTNRPQSAVARHPHYVRPAEPTVWQYSRCTGRKKALCIGINYIGTPEELRGCINDAHNVRHFLLQHNYKPEDIVLLSDDAPHSRQRPTRQNIRDAMRWLVRNARQDDALFFHYSGHGSQVEDKDGDEVDGYDEVILPSDFRKAGVITDDEMHDIMVKDLPTGCRLTALFDSCHSGSALDLPYLYHTDGRVKGSQVVPKFRAAKSSSADVISLSGCMDSQTSADVVEAGSAAGAMSHVFVKSLTRNPTQTYAELLRSVRALLRDKYKQKPQLSSSHRIDTGLRFII